MEWQDRIGWAYAAVPSGYGPPPVGTPPVGMPLQLPARSGYVDWSLLDWFYVQFASGCGGFPCGRDLTAAVAFLEPREILVDRYGDRLWDMTVGVAGLRCGRAGA